LVTVIELTPSEIVAVAVAPDPPPPVKPTAGALV